MFNFFRRKKKNNESVEIKKEKLFKEQFDLVEFLISPNPNLEFELSEGLVENVVNTLLSPLPNYLEKIAENPSDQQKAMLELSHQIKYKGSNLLGSSEWSYSGGNGIGARILIQGKNRIALLGSAHALARATVPYSLEIDQIVQKASKDGNQVFICAIDAIAVAVTALEHKLVEVTE